MSALLLASARFNKLKRADARRSADIIYHMSGISLFFGFFGISVGIQPWVCTLYCWVRH